MHQSPLGRASVLALATMVNNVSFVTMIKSLYPLLFATFTQAHSSPPDTPVSLGTLTVPSNISSYPLSSAMALNLWETSVKSCFLLLNLITLVNLKSP